MASNIMKFLNIHSCFFITCIIYNVNTVNLKMLLMIADSTKLFGDLTEQIRQA